MMRCRLCWRRIRVRGGRIFADNSKSEDFSCVSGGESYNPAFVDATSLPLAHRGESPPSIPALHLSGDKNMSDKHRKHFERGARVSAHCASYPQDFPANSVAGAALTRLNEQLAAIETLNMAKATSMSAQQQGSQGR